MIDLDPVADYLRSVASKIEDGIKYDFSTIQTKISEIILERENYIDRYIPLGYLNFLLFSLDFSTALKIVRHLNLDINLRWNLILICDDEIHGEDIIANSFRLLEGNKTVFKYFENKIIEKIELHLRKFEKENSTTFIEFVISKFLNDENFQGHLFGEDWYGERIKKITPLKEVNLRMWKFDFYNAEFEDKQPLRKFTKEFFKPVFDEIIDEENIQTSEKKWISQNTAFQIAKEMFDGYKVLREHSPSFLKRQRYDIFIPELNLALEYQGKQHFEIVDFFGGEKALLDNIKRDTRKREISQKHNITIEYINYDENIRVRINEIKDNYLKN